MSKHLQVGTLLDTKSVKEATFGDILIVSFTKTIPYTRIADTGQFKELGITPEDHIYKKVEAIFSQPNRINEVAVFGEDVSQIPVKEKKEEMEVETDPETKKSKRTAGDARLKEKLDEMWANNKKYYFVLTDKFNLESSKAVIEWAISKNLVPVYCTDKTTIVDKSIEFLKSLNNKAIAFATKQENDFIDAKMIGYMATQTPGKDKWEWKEPSGAIVSGFSLTEIGQLEDNGINTIQEEREGVLALFPGKCCNGEFIDIIWGNDNMQYDIETAFIRAEKSPYKIYHPGVDPRGVVQIESIVEEIILDYASNFREFIANDENGKPQAKIDVKTKYTAQQIAKREFEVSWVAIPSGSASYGKVSGLLTFDKDKVKEGV